MATYTYVGTPQIYVVGFGVTLLQIECRGAQGGRNSSGTYGGAGGYVKATLPVTPGETLGVNVGGAGGTYNGGAVSDRSGLNEGGGMSDVRQGGTSTADIVVAGGGGGGAGDIGAGGGGGSPSGGGGAYTHPGGGGSQVSGGTYGGGGSHSGAAFTGGNGDLSGGGGGGGYFGGGGGNASSGGGGGSSWVGPTAFNALFSNGVVHGNGSVVITVAASAAPTLLTPTNSAYIDASGTVTLAWIYSESAAGTTQTGYQARQKIGAGAYGYWNGADWSSPTPVTNSTSSQSAATTGLSNGNIYNWSIATVDSNGVGAFATDFIFTGADPPTVSVTAPTGTATTDPVAHIAWTPTVAGAETGWRAIVYTAAQYGAGGFVPGVGPSAWDSLQTGGSGVSTDSAPLVNATYRAYVQVTQTGGQVSAWDYSGFTINCTAPTAPTLVSVYDATNARVTHTVTASTSGLTVSLQVSADAGVTWNAVRDGTNVVTGGGNIATIYDYDAAPLGILQYRALNSTSFLVPSAFSTVANVTISTQTGFWLKDLKAGTTLRLHVLKGTLTTHYPEALTEHQPLGSPAALIIADVVGLEDGGCTVFTQNSSEEIALMKLLLSQKTLLFQSPDGRSWYIRITSPRPTGTPYLVNSGGYREHAITWRGQPNPSADDD